MWGVRGLTISPVASVVHRVKGACRAREREEEGEREEKGEEGGRGKGSGRGRGREEERGGGMRLPTCSCLLCDVLHANVIDEAAAE